jgi:hypothetical protein
MFGVAEAGGVRWAGRRHRPLRGCPALLAVRGVRAKLACGSNTRGPDPRTAALLGGASTAGPAHTARLR